MRRFYDWLNPSPYYPQLLDRRLRRLGAQLQQRACRRPADVLLAGRQAGGPGRGRERYFVQDFFIEQARNAEPLSLGYYPLHTPHSYVLLAFEAWLDHYRATGAAKYLEAARGAWRIVKDSYEHVGGTIAICEMGPATTRPAPTTWESTPARPAAACSGPISTTGSCSCTPDEERYAAEIEKVIFNVILAVSGRRRLDPVPQPPARRQGDAAVRQHLLRGHGRAVHRQAAAVHLLARRGRPVRQPVRRLRPSPGSAADRTSPWRWPPGSPDGAEVTLTVATAAPVKIIVAPTVSGVDRTGVPVRVNGEVIAEGPPGTYVVLERHWADRDQIRLCPPAGFRLTRYTGLDSGQRVGSLTPWTYGPLLMALVGPRRPALPPA